MKQRLIGLLHRMAPRTIDGLADLALARERHGSIADALDRLESGPVRLRVDLERELTDVRDEIDELRVEGRRVAELYDLVFERVRAERRGEPGDDR